MSDNLVTFNIRYEKSLFELKIEIPEDLLGFVGKLKNELQLEDADEIVLLCPTPEGKMMEIKSDADIHFLKKTKLCYDGISRNIYCNVELVVLIPHEKLPDDPRAQIMILSEKVDQLASQFTKLSQSIDNKLKSNAANILKDIKYTLNSPLCSTIPTAPLWLHPSLFSENMQFSTDNTSKTYVSEELKHIPKLETSKSTGLQKSKKYKKKLSSSTNDKLTGNSNQKKESSPPSDSDDEYDMLMTRLKQEGFSSSIQNILAIKRFGLDYEKIVTFLKSD